jgi:hypothetical protein
LPQELADVSERLQTIEQLHEAVRTGLASKLHDIPTVAHYPAVDAALALPAVLIELAQLAPASDPGGGEMGLLAHFQARVVCDAAAAGAALQVRGLAARVALAIHNETWNLAIGAAQFVLAAPALETGAADDSGRLAWLLEWTHEIELGQAEWPHEDSSGAVLMLGLAPDTGAGREALYWPAGAAPAI